MLLHANDAMVGSGPVAIKALDEVVVGSGRGIGVVGVLLHLVFADLLRESFLLVLLAPCPEEIRNADESHSADGDGYGDGDSRRLAAVLVLGDVERWDGRRRLRAGARRRARQGSSSADGDNHVGRDKLRHDLAGDNGCKRLYNG